MAFLRAVAATLFILSVSLFFILTNVRVLANEVRLYNYGVDHYNADLISGIPKTELHRANEELIRYFNSDEDAVRIRVQDNRGQTVPLFNPKEVTHLKDVKKLFSIAFRVQEGATAFALLYVVAVFVWAREASLRTLATQALTASVATLGIVGSLGSVALLGFDEAFLKFHQLSFTNNFYLLDPAKDHLVQMFPQGFWFDATLLIGLGAMLESLLLAGVAVGYLWMTRRRPVTMVLAGHSHA